MAGKVRSFLYKNTDMSLQNDPLSAFLPKKFGKNVEEPPPTNGQLEDDEYEVEQPMGDEAVMAMLPMSFGKQDKKRDFSETFAKTKRVVYQPFARIAN